MKRHSEPLLFTLINLTGNLLPIIFSLIFYGANPHKWPGWQIFYNQGQFYLYVAAFLTSAAYIFYTFKVINTDLNSILLIVTCLLILGASILYVLKIVGFNNEDDFLFKTSVSLSVITIALYYYANFQNSMKVDVVAAQRAGINNIMNGL
jgi:hypothetical protein